MLIGRSTAAGRRRAWPRAQRCGAFKASFSSRASRAMSLTASNSSRLTTIEVAQRCARPGCAPWFRTRAARPRRRRRRHSSAARSRRRSGCWSGSSLHRRLEASGSSQSQARTMAKRGTGDRNGRHAAAIRSRLLFTKPSRSIELRSRRMLHVPASRCKAGDRNSTAGAAKSRRKRGPDLRGLDFAGCLPASPAAYARTQMPLYVMPFPDFDPVLVSIGPFAIRWYALAYIVGILLGWLYARALIRARAALGRAGADDRRRLRRLHPVGDARHHPRRPPRLRAVLQSGLFRRASAGDRCSSGRAACRFTAAFSAACSRSCCSRAIAAFRSCRSATSPARPGRSACSSAGIANFINGELWGRPTDVPWAMVFPGGGPLPRHPSQLYEALARRAAAVRRAGAADRAPAR